jgi:hypothetical protein
MQSAVTLFPLLENRPMHKSQAQLMKQIDDLSV